MPGKKNKKTSVPRARPEGLAMTYLALKLGGRKNLDTNEPRFNKIPFNVYLFSKKEFVVAWLPFIVYFTPIQQNPE